MSGALSESVPSRLARKLGTADAVVIGLASMFGAGVFSALGPAAGAARNAVLLALLVAGMLAYCNATSSAQLAALYPQSGGAYVYGCRRLGHPWGFLAGWSFIVGKVASCAAMALTFGHYAAPAPGFERLLALGAVVALTAVNVAGIGKTAAVSRVIVALVLVVLTICVVATVAGGTFRVTRLWPLEPVDARGVLRAAGLLFFAFAGYARIATLGEEVRDPARTIPRAIPIALFIVLVVYGAVAVGALGAVGSDTLARSPAPLADAVRAGTLGALVPIVRVGAALASLGVLLSLIAGISRTAFAMASAGDLPAALSVVHPTARTPHRAEILAGGLIVVVLAVLDVGQAIAFSSFSVLLYYAVTNASALTLSAHERRWPRPLAALGLVGCVVVAANLPRPTIIYGLGTLLVGLVVFLLQRSRARRSGRTREPETTNAKRPRSIR